MAQQTRPTTCFLDKQKPLDFGIVINHRMTNDAWERLEGKLRDCLAAFGLGLLQFQIEDYNTGNSTSLTTCQYSVVKTQTINVMANSAEEAQNKGLELIKDGICETDVTVDPV